MDCISWGHKELDMTERLSPPITSLAIYMILSVNIFLNWMINSFSSVAQSCLTLCNPIDYTFHGIPQARILEWIAFPFSRGSS